MKPRTDYLVLTMQSSSLQRCQPPTGPPELADATRATRAKTWCGVVTGFTSADCERVRAFDAKRVAMRIMGSDLQVFVVVASIVSAAALGRRMGIVASWEKGDGSPAHWQRILSTHTVVLDTTHQGKRQRPAEIAQDTPAPHLKAPSTLPVLQPFLVASDSADMSGAESAENVVLCARAQERSGHALAARERIVEVARMSADMARTKARLKDTAAMELEQATRDSITLEVHPVAWCQQPMASTFPIEPEDISRPTVASMGCLCLEMTDVSIYASRHEGALASPEWHPTAHSRVAPDADHIIEFGTCKVTFDDAVSWSGSNDEFIEWDSSWSQPWRPLGPDAPDAPLRFKVESMASLSLDEEAQQLRFNAVTLEVLCYAEHLAEELHEHAKTLGRMVPILDEPGLGFRFVWEKWSRYAVHVSGGKYGSDFIRGTCRLRNLHPSLPRPNQARSLALAGDDQVTVVMTYANKADWLKIMHMCPQYWRITGWRGPCMVHPWGPAIGGVRRATGPPPLDPRVRDTKERWERHKHWWVDHRCGTSVGRPCAHPRRRRCVVIASVLNKRKYPD